MPPLHDPDKPAHHIIERNADGTARRNDGQELAAAETNIWYIMMTAAGVPESLDDEEIIAANRRLWNGWACGQLPPEERAKIAALLDVPAKDLAPLTEQEQHTLTQALRTRLGDNTVNVPDRDESIDLKSIFFDLNCTYFSDNFSLEAFYIPKHIFFLRAVFEGDANFSGTVFHRNTFFSEAVFHRHTFFSGAVFNDTALFAGTVFNGKAEFKAVIFEQVAFFNRAIFKIHASFSDSQFLSATNFTEARFTKLAPRFYQTQFHEDTAFTTDDEYWPKITKNGIIKNFFDEDRLNKKMIIKDGPDKGIIIKDRTAKDKIIKDIAADSKRAYIRLRQQMNKLQKRDDEHFFYRQEMDCKALLEGRFYWLMAFLFKGLSNYGYSVIRPLSWLGLLILLCGVAYWGFWVDIDSCGLYYPKNFGGFIGALGQSISTSFPFFGFQKLYYAADFYTVQPAWLRVISGFQTVISFMLIFLLGLGLRNRFRLK